MPDHTHPPFEVCDECQGVDPARPSPDVTGLDLDAIRERHEYFTRLLRGGSIHFAGAAQASADDVPALLAAVVSLSAQLYAAEGSVLLRNQVAELQAHGVRLRAAIDDANRREGEARRAALKIAMERDHWRDVAEARGRGAEPEAMPPTDRFHVQVHDPADDDLPSRGWCHVPRLVPRHLGAGLGRRGG